MFLKLYGIIRILMMEEGVGKFLVDGLVKVINFVNVVLVVVGYGK